MNTISLMRKFSSLVSYLLHPLLMPLYCMVLIFFNPNYLSIAVRPRLQILIYIIVFITTFLMPSLSALFLIYRGNVQSLQMERREERTMPFLITSIYFIICYYLIRQLPIPVMLSSVIRGAVLSTVLALLINFRWKISIHMVGIGGAAGMLLALSRFIYADYSLHLIIIFLVAGILGSARIYSGGHSPAQVYAGFCTGAVIEYMAIIT